MPRKSDKDKLKEIEDIKVIKSIEDISIILKGIHVMWRNSDIPAKKFLYLLTGETEYTYEQCLDFYVFTLKHYIDSDAPGSKNDLEMILSIGGFSDKYKNLKNSAQCREAYSDEHKEDTNANTGNLIKREDTVLNKVAGELYKDFCSGEIVVVIDLWKIKIRPNHPFPPSEKPEKLFEKIKSYIKKIINDKPQYCLGTLAVIIFITVPLLLIALSNIYSTKNQRKASISDGGNRIQSIFIANDNLKLAPGEKGDPGIAIAPADADRSHLKHEISNNELVDLTLNWEVVGLSGGQNFDTDTVEIDIWGDDAKRVTIYVTVEAEYIDRADDGADVDIKTLD